MRRMVLALVAVLAIGPAPTPTADSGTVVEDLLDGLGGLLGGGRATGSPSPSGGPTPTISPAVPAAGSEPPATPSPRPPLRHPTRGVLPDGAESGSPVSGAVPPGEEDPAAYPGRRSLGGPLLTVVSVAGAAVLSVGVGSLVWYVRRVRRRSIDPDG